MNSEIKTPLFGKYITKFIKTEFHIDPTNEIGIFSRFLKFPYTIYSLGGENGIGNPSHGN